MLEYALKGTKKYWGWLLFLSVIILVGVYFYYRQFNYGLGITGLAEMLPGDSILLNLLF
jgi:hypothetical protein